ncbi:flavin reductase family protein [Bacteroides sp. KG68]|uniref:flavin reductase family protein n=1 Tax=unclassified Bacteroides TaxID=2646097 RepID=UPI003D98AC1E
MEKQPINIIDSAGDILKALQLGGLVTTWSGDKINSMVIEWGTLGFNWGRPVFVCYVRQSRFTREMLDSNPEFTINLPVNEYDKRIIRVCGSKSGRDTDKVAELGLTLIGGSKVSAPAIKEVPLTLECKVIYRQEQDHTLLPMTLQKRFYPDIPTRNHDNAEDEHIVYFGEIVDAYLLKERE